MRLYRPILTPLCLLLLLPFGAKAQKPLDEGQRMRIGITVQQQKELEAVFAGADQQRRAAFTRLHALYHELHTLYDSYEFDSQRARTLKDEIVAQHQRLLTLYADNETKMRRILNREQFERLRALMKAEREKRRLDRAKGEGKEWRKHP